MEILEKRFPKIAKELESLHPKTFEQTQSPYPTHLVGGVQLTSAWNPVSEAIMKLSHIKNDVKTVWLYGPGGGYCQFYLTNKEQYPLIEQINVVILSRECLLACIDLKDQSSWLEDPRVNIIMAYEFENVALPLVSCPASIQNTDADCTNLRGVLIHSMSQEFVSQYLKAREGLEEKQWQENKIYEDRDPFVTDWFQKHMGQSAFVAMGGPTLPDNLRHAWKYDVIICATTSMKALQEARIKPHYVVLEDPLKCSDHYNGVDIEWFKDSILFYNPTCEPLMLKMWPWKRGRTRPERQKPLLFEGGSVVHTAADLAVQLGCSNVAFAGADFCNVNDKTHYAGAAQEQEAKDPWRPLETNGLGQRVYSANNLVWYKLGLEFYCRNHPQVKFNKYDKRGLEVKGASWIGE